jgi:glycosyltransferase involved in cell wall biosynthesis
LDPPKTFGFPYELNYFRYNLGVVRALRVALRRESYQLLYQRMSIMNYAGVVLSRMLRIPLILEYNGSEVWIAKNWGRPLRFSWLALRMENLCLQHAHRIVVVSTPLADELVERGIERERIVNYPNCVDLTHYGPDVVPPEAASGVRTRHGLAHDAVLVSFVGTFGRWHGAPVLAAAIKKLVDEEDEWLRKNKVHFVLVGDGLLMKEVRAPITGDKYAPWAVFTGLVPQADTVNYLATVDILVSPHVRNTDGSKFFGSPTKLFEYMAMGKGIIASDLDQIGEVLSAGIRIWEQPDAVRSGTATAILVRPGNVDDLLNAIKLLVEYSQLRKNLGANARAEVARKYTWQHHVSAILDSIGKASGTVLESNSVVVVG